MTTEAPLATLIHRTSVQRAASFWEYDPARHLLMATVKLGEHDPVDLELVTLCTHESPRRFSWTISPASDAWLVHPTRYELSRFVPSPFHSDWPIGFLRLIGAPPEVSRDLRRL